MSVPGSGRFGLNAFARAWWRIVRRVVFGDHARDDEVTGLLDTLRPQANWAFLVPRAARRATHPQAMTHVRADDPRLPYLRA